MQPWGGCHVSNCNGDGCLDLVGLEAHQPHLSKYVVDLIFESLCICLSFLDHTAEEFEHFVNSLLLTVPEHISLMKLLLCLLLLLEAALSFMVFLLLALVFPLLLACEDCFPFLLQDNFSISYLILLKLPHSIDFIVDFFFLSLSKQRSIDSL